jgi:hypothetical protein
MDHVTPLAYTNNLLLLPELYELLLSVFMYKSCKLGYNAEMFENSGYTLLSSGFNTRGYASFNYFVPYCRTSLRKDSVIHKAVTIWNNLPQPLKLANSLSCLKNGLFAYLLARYVV